MRKNEPTDVEETIISPQKQKPVRLIGERVRICAHFYALSKNVRTNQLSLGPHVLT